MKLAFLSPTKYLDKVSVRGDMHLVLAHRVLTDEKYCEFYRREKKYKILDNGAFELGNPMRTDDILKAAEMVDADEVVAPDVFNDGHRTIESTRNFVCRIRTLDPGFKNKEYRFKVMGVPHGKDFIDWLVCFSKMYEHNQIDVIGIGFKSVKVMEPLWPHEPTESALRVKLVKALVHTFPNKTIHLLGGGSNPIEALLYKEVKQVRSLDTKLAYLCGQMDIKFDTKTGADRPKGELDLDYNVLTQEQQLIVDSNVQTMKEWAR